MNICKLKKPKGKEITMMNIFKRAYYSQLHTQHVGLTGNSQRINF